MNASEKMDIVQKTVRARTKQQRRVDTSGQEEMDFIEAETTNIDDTVDMETVKQYWLDKLSSVPGKFGIEDLANMLEESNWFEKDLQQAFNELIDEGRAVNIDKHNKRPINPVHFDKNERLQRIEQ